MLRRIDRSRVLDADEALHLDEMAGRSGELRKTTFVDDVLAVYLLVGQYEDRGSQAVPTNTKSFVPLLPGVLNPDDNVRKDIKRDPL